MSEQEYLRLFSVLQTHRIHTCTFSTVCHTLEHANIQVPAAANKTIYKNTCIKKEGAFEIVKADIPETMLVNLWVKITCICYILLTNQEMLKRRDWRTLGSYQSFMINYKNVYKIHDPWPYILLTWSWGHLQWDFFPWICLLYYQWKLKYSPPGGGFVGLCMLWSFMYSTQIILKDTAFGEAVKPPPFWLDGGRIVYLNVMNCLIIILDPGLALGFSPRTEKPEGNEFWKQFYFISTEFPACIEKMPYKLGMRSFISYASRILQETSSTVEQTTWLFTSSKISSLWRRYRLHLLIC